MCFDAILWVRRGAILRGLIDEFLPVSMKSPGGHTEHIYDIRYNVKKGFLSASETPSEFKGLFDDTTLYSLWADQSDCWKICAVPGCVSCN